MKGKELLKSEGMTKLLASLLSIVIGLVVGGVIVLIAGIGSKSQRSGTEMI